ncbi:MAG: hypothetical protein ACI4UF_04025, partial [Thermoguttaceae bacterium]
MRIPSLLLVAFLTLTAALTAFAQNAALDDARKEKTGDFFISLSGNDSWSGKLSAPNADRTDGPFATLEKARD